MRFTVIDGIVRDGARVNPPVRTVLFVAPEGVVALSADGVCTTPNRGPVHLQVAYQAA